jgi:transcriptional regulator with XRE-family HTH domain
MFGDRLKYIRESKGFTLKAFAELLSTSPGFLSEVENGHKKPGFELLSSLKRILGVDLNWLLNDEEAGMVAYPPVEYHGKSPIVERIDQMLEDMDEDGQRDVLKYAEEKKLIAELLKERKGGAR